MAALDEIAALRAELRNFRGRIAKVERMVNELVTEDKIASAVTERMHRERAAMFSLPAKVVALVVGICAIASFVLQVVPN